MTETRPPMPKGMGRDELKQRTLVALSTREWHRVPDDIERDPTAIEVYTMGYQKADVETIFLISRHDDEELSLISFQGSRAGAITKDQVHIKWLWDIVKAQAVPT